jgi:hypothetical protein
VAGTFYKKGLISSIALKNLRFEDKASFFYIKHPNRRKIKAIKDRGTAATGCRQAQGVSAEFREQLSGKLPTDVKIQSLATSIRPGTNHLASWRRRAPTANRESLRHGG